MTHTPAPRSPIFENWQRELLISLPIARLATIAKSGQPHLVPVCFALLGEAIVIAIDEKPKRAGGAALARLRDIRRDPRVTFLADRYEDDWRRLAWVRVDGRALIVPRGEARPLALEALRRRYPQYQAMALESLPLIEITAEKVVGWRFAPR